MNGIHLSIWPIIFVLLAQAQAPSFEVVSVKPNDSGITGFSITPFPGGRLQARNIPLRRLIATAYTVTDSQVVSKIPWLETARFDLDAKASGPATTPELRLMLQPLLEDRFKLKMHREAREMSIYTLTLSKNGVKGGPGLIEAPNGDCGTPPSPKPSDSPASAPQQTVRFTTPCGVVGLGPGRINGQRARIVQLVDRLSTLLGRPVVDKTGLEGSWDIRLTWTPDPDPEAGTPAPANLDTAAPSLFTALAEQLGLKLQAGKGPVEVIVVDSAEKPSAN